MTEQILPILCDDGEFKVELLSRAGGAHPAGEWGELTLMFTDKRGETLRNYVDREALVQAQLQIEELRNQLVERCMRELAVSE